MLAIAPLLLMGAELPGNAFDRFGWLSGHWTTETEGAAASARWQEEIWTRPRGLNLIGLGRWGQGERVGGFEQMRFTVGAGGAIFLEARVDGGEPVRFRLRESGANRAVFEQPYHDYPQRIVYTREGDRLTAAISLMDGSRRTEWTYRLRNPL
jgi:hypothetical protein